MTKSLLKLGSGFLLFMVVAALWVVMSAARHPEATMIRDTYGKKLCRGTEVYFSPPQGTVLVLCGLESGMWGGLIYRVSEDYGHVLTTPYEVTVFAAKRSYWDAVLARDFYSPILVYPDIENWFNSR